MVGDLFEEEEEEEEGRSGQARGGEGRAKTEVLDMISRLTVDDPVGLNGEDEAGEDDLLSLIEVSAPRVGRKKSPKAIKISRP